MKQPYFILPVFFLILSSQVAWSDDFSGHWLLQGGQIQAKNLGMPAGKPIPCSSIEIQISLTPQELIIDSYHAHCDSLDSKWGPYPMQLRDGKVYTDNEEAGTFDGKNLDVRLRGGYYLKFELKPSAQVDEPPILATLYGVTNVVQSLEISGALPRQ